MQDESLDLSLNEVELVAAKAARGAGLHWGAAEDLGRAARWLAGNALDWAPQLLGFLASSQCAEAVARASETADLIDRGADHTLAGPPLWIAALLAPACARHGRAAELTWPGARLYLGWGRDAWIEGTVLPSGWTVHETEVTIATGLPPGGRLGSPSARSLVTAQDWQALSRLAVLTYVPASDRSRQAGAGASLTDND